MRTLVAFALCSGLSAGLLAGCGDQAKPEPEPAVAAAGAKPIIPDDDLAAITRFESMLQQGANQQMIEELPPYLETYSKSYKGHHLLGWAYARSDRLDEAMAAFERATELNPKWDNAYVGQGVVWRKRGELDKAVAAYQKALEINPKAAEAYSSLTAIELKRGDYQKAYEFGLKAWELSNKKDPTIAANLALACHYAEDEKKRDEMVTVARSLGYPNMAKLEGMISGEIAGF